MPNGKNASKKLSPEEKALESAKNEVVKNNKRKEYIIERFGPDSKLDESGRSTYNNDDRELYKSMKLPRPKGLTDEMIALIALGDALDPKRLNKPLTSSSVGGNQNDIEFNQTYIIANVIEGDPRTKNYGKILCESKANTINILKEYQKGNTTPAQEALERSVKALTSSIGMQRTDSATSNPPKETFRIINEMRKIPDLNVDNMLTEKEKAKLTALEHKMRASDKAAEAAAELMEKMPPANSPAREKIVLEYLFNNAVGSEGYNNYIESELDKQKTQEVHDLLDKYKDFDPRSKGSVTGLFSNCIMKDSNTLHHYLSPEAENLGREIVFANDHLKGVVLDETIFPAEGIIAADNNTDRLRTFSEEEIKKSEYFKQLMNAANVLDMDKLLKSVPLNGFAAYPGVKIPDDDAKRLGGEFDQAKYDAKKQEIENNIQKYMKDVYPQQYAEKYGIEIEKPVPSASDKSVLRSSKNLNDLYNSRNKAICGMFGPEGKLSNSNGCRFDQNDIDAYNAITLQKPEGLSDETIALIAIGAAMNPKRLNRELTGSSMPSTDLVRFNQDFIFTNILPGDGRTKKFGSVLVESRKETAEILEAYKAGNLEPAKEALKRVAERNIKSIGGRNFRNSASKPENYFHGALQNVKKEHPELDVDKYYTEAQNIKEKVNAIQVEHSKKAFEAQQKLLNELPPPNSPERKRLVKEYLFSKEISSAGYASKDESSIKAKGDIYKLCEKYGAMFPNKKMNGETFFYDSIIGNVENEIESMETIALRGKIATATDKLERSLRQVKFSNVEGILANEGGVEKLKKASSEYIEESSEYLKLINAKDVSSLNELMKVESNGNFYDKFNYTVPSADAKKLKFKSEQYDKQLSEIAKDIEQYAKTSNPDKYAHAFDPKTIVDDAIGLMSSDKALHIDSKEIKNARSDAKLLKAAMNSSKFENVMDDPKVKEALLAAYKSSVQYKAVKKKDAKIAPDDHDWQPKSNMGKDRYKGVSTIEDLARKYIMPEIAKLANEEIKAEEAANSDKTMKQYADTELQGYKITLNPIKKAQEILKNKAEANNGRRDSLAEIPVGASEYSDELAQIIAANLLGRSYDQLPDDTEFVDEYEEKYEKMVKDTTADIKKRDDFKRMVSELDPEEAIKLGMTTEGKGLIMKLAETSKTMLAEEKTAQKAAAAQLDAPKKNNGPKQMGG